MVKVPPMQTLLEALQAASSKFKPALVPQQCALQYNKKPVDLNTPFRLLNVPAGSKLEVIINSEFPHIFNCVTISMSVVFVSSSCWPCSCSLLHGNACSHNSSRWGSRFRLLWYPMTMRFMALAVMFKRAAPLGTCSWQPTHPQLLILCNACMYACMHACTHTVLWIL